VPWSAEDVKTLESMAAQIGASTGAKPSLGQLASVIVRLHLSALQSTPEPAASEEVSRPSMDQEISRRFGEAEGASVALDWYILEPDSYQEFSSHRRRWFRHGRAEPGAHVAMEEDAHRALLSRCGHLPLLRRAADYYEDAAYGPDEVGGLLDELVSIGPRAGAAAELEALCREALRRRGGLVAIAD
jgi:hypothetical protein